MIGVESLSSLPRASEVSAARVFADRFLAALRVGWAWVGSTQAALRARSERRSLRVQESLSLGDKRSLYLIEVDGQRLLLGACAGGLTLLRQLPPAKEAWQHAVKDLVFAEVMESCETGTPKRRKAAPRATTKDPA